jgi:hypothetical protein
MQIYCFLIVFNFINKEIIVYVLAGDFLKEFGTK